jgi:DNA repair protein RecN (Recombination protein N)
MLVRLTISNFALIDELTVNFEQGLNIITGETGAGKSIILGALSLILGARADTASIRDVSKKCVVEGAFRLDSLSLESFFTENDLDFDKTTILRREITPSGKTRSFINDTPVNLQQMRELTLRLVDIHSQHQNLELNNQMFQLQVVDVVAQSQGLLLDYKRCFAEFNALSAKLATLRETASRAKADLDYHEFQFNQLSEANLQPGEEEEMEEERQKLSHAEEIKSALAHVADLLDGDKFPVLVQVKEALGRLDKIRHFMKEADEFHQRLESVYIELQDIAHETVSLAENTEFNPQRLEQIAGRLDLIYSLQQKHQLSTVAQLIELRDSLSVKISMVADYEEEIAGLEKLLAQSRESMNEAARKLSLKRKGVFHEMEKKVVDVLHQLGIPHALFKVDHQIRDTLISTGADQIQFLFSANKNGTPDEISRIASGGEISRVMLALKTLVSGSRMLPTIIFDEIDAGISGEIALQMASILKKLSSGMQVINITHLPQIAGRGDHHYKVYKYENETATMTSIRKLDEMERVEELAIMLGGANPTDTVRRTARELMQSN